LSAVRVVFQFLQTDTGYLEKKQLRSRQAMFGPSGSPKSKAPIAEASTTLTSISICPNEVCRLRSALQPEATYLLEHFLHAEGRLFPDSLLKNGQKLTLQRTVILLCSGSQPTDNVIRSILNRKVYRHQNDFLLYLILI